ncbi:rhodanese-like domain-containing protein [Flagellimonas nanhaiensis]|uniref:Rhodanese-like domain-containing protein n=1 Tax=Flagellimonas nanhaiensis TaxID=2292706 RepID=A0A371JRE5_9FLAO|nr:rhodanese-like domain-containing protein [Allomuricauda nanhaiensis]RDY60069.1 rhodanese-like domain-containing protein [Allomuricauda nanhaiensis]
MSIFSFLFGGSGNTSDAIKVLDGENYKRAISKGKVQLVDVRTPREYGAGHIKNAKNIDFFQRSSFEAGFSKLEKGKPVYLYCQSGNRSLKAARRLVAMGFSEIYDLKGGYRAWSY